MVAIRLGEFRGDSIVVHFGGGERNINAYTFAQSLTGFADTARAISASIDPGQEIEILIEAIGPGSFRTVVRRITKDYGGVFSGPVKIIFWGIVTAVIYDNLIKPADKPPQVIVNTTEVIITLGTHEIVVPRNVYDAAENAKKSSDVRQGLRKTFEPLERDRKITEFGLTTHIDDSTPLITIPRVDFPRFTEGVTIVEETPAERTKTESARLVILKAWLNHAKRKWSFEWNGVPLSAPIVDQDFLDRIERREYLIGAGDALDVEITFKQHFDERLAVYVNDPSSFIIPKVLGHIASSVGSKKPGKKE